MEAITEGVWGVRTRIRLLPGAYLPLRMTVLRDGDGLLLHSPVAIDDALAAELAALAKVRTLLGPNRMHHLYLAAAKARFPDAKLLGAPGLADKRPDLSFDGTAPNGALSDAIEAHCIAGAEKLSEVALLHRPSRTLVLTDAVFNVHGARGLSAAVLRLVSGLRDGECGQSRLIRVLTSDRDATARSIEALLAWDFERIVMSHGEVIDQDAKARLEAALWWWRKASRPRRTV